MIEQQIRICSYDVLPDGNVKPSALQRYFQQIALDDISQCGATYPAMRSHSMVFVLTKLQIDWIQQIHSGDTFTLRTYPYKVEGVTFFRAFEIWKDDTPLCVADSRWVLLNYRTRTIMRPSDFPFSLSEQAPTLEMPILPRRIAQIGQIDTQTQRTVLLSELDENRHLNNCCYSDYSLDHAPVDVCAHPILSMCILFEHEAYLDDTLDMSYQKTPDGFTVIARNSESKKGCFQAKFILDF